MAISTTNIVGFSYVTLAQNSINTITNTMNAVIGKELTYVVPTLKAAGVLFILRQFFLIHTGYLSKERFLSSLFRVLVIVYLITSSGQYVQRIEQPIFNNVPQAISSAILSASGTPTTSAMSIAQQFDAVSAMADAVTGLVQQRATVWSPSSYGRVIAAWIANGFMQSVLGIIAWVWLQGQRALGIVLCFGPYLLIFELFDRTRGFVDQWIGKLVGVLSFGLGTGVVLAYQMTDLLQVLTSAANNMPTSDDAATSVLFHVLANIVQDAFTMLALPGLCAFGAGVAASYASPVLSAVSGAGGGWARGASRAAAGRLAAATRRGAARGAGNSASRI